MKLMAARQLTDVGILAAKVHLLLAHHAKDGRLALHIPLTVLRRHCHSSRCQGLASWLGQLGDHGRIDRWCSSANHLSVTQVEVPPRQVRKAQEFVESFTLLDARDQLQQRCEVPLDL
jgi:hypothetical protein